MGNPLFNPSIFPRHKRYHGRRNVADHGQARGPLYRRRTELHRRRYAFGRNWGCVEDHRFLHFEVCYYQAIDYAIANGLKRVEAGAQGGYKVVRATYPSRPTRHWIADPGFRDAVSRFLEEERSYVAQDIAHVEQHSPFNATIDLSAVRGQ